MKYIEVKIETPSERIEEVIARLLSLGITDVVIDDPRETVKMIGSAGETEWFDTKELWKEAEEFDEYLNAPAFVSFYLDYNIADFPGELYSRLTDELSDFIVTYRIVDDGDWKDRWKEYFVPTRVSNRIVVSPTWARDEDIKEIEREGDIVIRIDPGTAFGTGTHETTALTLTLMDDYLSKKEDEVALENGSVGSYSESEGAGSDIEGEGTGIVHKVDGKRVLDVGTGSGILSIAALLMGAKDVLAIDIDEDAVKAAEENINLNLNFNSNTNFSRNPIFLPGEDTPNNYELPNIKVMIGDLTKGVDYKADLIVANLLSDLVIRFAPDAAKHLEKGGCFISSGILIEKKDQVSQAIEKAGFKIQRILEAGDWCAIQAVRV